MEVGKSDNDSIKLRRIDGANGQLRKFLEILGGELILRLV